MQYKILTGRNIDNLSVIVNNQIEKGWKPQGGVLINGMMYAQAMVRNDD
jgi:hypothetical protein